MASYMFSFQGFSQIICAEGHVHPGDNFSCILQGKLMTKREIQTQFSRCQWLGWSTMSWQDSSCERQLLADQKLWIAPMVTKAGITYWFSWGNSCRFLVHLLLIILLSRKGKSQLRFWWQCCGLGTGGRVSLLGRFDSYTNFQLLQHQKLI